MGDTVKTFSFEQACVITINGIPLKGFHDGVALAVEFPEDNWTKHVGLDGEVTRIYQARKDGRITMRLSYGSVAAQQVQALLLADEITRSAPVTISAIDTLSGTTAFARSAWPMKHPGFEWSDELDDLEYVFDTAGLKVDLRATPGL